MWQRLCREIAKSEALIVKRLDATEMQEKNYTEVKLKMQVFFGHAGALICEGGEPAGKACQNRLARPFNAFKAPLR